MYIGGVLYFISFLFFINCLFNIRHIGDLRVSGFGFLLGCYGVITLKLGLFFTGDIVNFPRLLGIEPMMHSFTVTLYLYYLPYLGGVAFKWKNWKNLALIAPALQIILYLDYLFKDSAWHSRVAETSLAGAHALYFPGDLSRFLHMGYLGSLFPVATYLFLKIFDWKKVVGPKRSNVKAGFVVVLFWILFCMVLTAEYSWNAFWGYRQSPWNPVLMYGSAILFFHFWQLWPYYIKTGSVMFEASTFNIEGFYRRRLEGVNLKSLKEKLNRILDQEKVFMRDDLSLKTLAEITGVRPDQLSEYLNLHLQISFADLVNHKRVEEAKRLLLEDQTKSPTEVCYEVGYNSISSFYGSFKKITGQSPKAWQEEHTGKRGVA